MRKLACVARPVCTAVAAVLVLSTGAAVAAFGERARTAPPRTQPAPKTAPAKAPATAPKTAPKAAPATVPATAAASVAATAPGSAGEASARAAVFEYTAGRPDRAARLAAQALKSGATGAVSTAAVRFLRAEALLQSGDPKGADVERSALLSAAPNSPWARAALDLCALDNGACAGVTLDPATAAQRGPLGLVAAVAQGERMARTAGARQAEAWGKPIESTAAAPFWLIVLAHAHLAARDTVQCAAALERAVDRAAKMDNGDLVSEAALRRAALAYHRGDPALALTWVNRVTDEKGRTLSCPAAIVTGYAHYALGHAKEAAVAFNYAQACARDKGERGRLLALEARCRAQSGEYRLAAAVAGDGAQDLEAAARGEGVGQARLEDATDVLEGALLLDVDRAGLAREFFFRQAALEGWLTRTAETSAWTGFPFRVVREQVGEGARAEAMVAQAPTLEDTETPERRAAVLAALAAADVRNDRARFLAAIGRDVTSLADTLAALALSPADSAAYVTRARSVIDDVANQAARAAEAQGRATALVARARADRARALAAEAAPAPERREDRAAALERSVLAREGALLRARADSAEARSTREAALWRGPRAQALLAEEMARLGQRQAQARAQGREARALAARVGPDPELERLTQAQASAARAADDAVAADSVRRLGREQERATVARAHTAKLAERARTDYEVALFERGAWATIALDEADSTEADLAPAIAANEDFLTRFPNSTYVPATLFNRADLEVKRALARARATNRPPDFSVAIARYEKLLAASSAYPRKDAVLFNLAILARESGDNAAADRDLARLLAASPSGDLAAEAHAELGDRALDAEQWAEAEAHFAAVAAIGGNLAPMARYKQGFAALKRGDAAVASEAFAALLATENLPPEIADDGLAQLAKALRLAGGAPAAERYLEAHKDATYGNALLVTIANQEEEDGAFDRAAGAWRLVLERYPTDPHNVDYARKIVSSWDSRSRDDERIATRIDLGRYLAPTGKGGALGPEGRSLGATYLLEAGFLEHERGRSKKDRAALERAVTIYRDMERLYPASDSLALAAGSEGEALFDLERFGEAARAHERALVDVGTRTAATADTVRRESAFGAALARERIAGADSYRRAGDRDSLERAIGRLEKAAPGDPRVPPLWLSLALGAKANADSLRARRVFEHVAGKDTSEASRRAQSELGRIALSENRWADAERLYAAGAAGYLAAGDKAEEGRLTELAASARFKEGEALEAKRDTVLAATTFRALADRYPNFSRADVALYRAGLDALAGGAPRAAEEHLATLAERYPQSKLLDDAILRRGEAQLALRDTLAAAQTLATGRLAATGGLGVDALEEAGRLYRSAGAYTDAEATYRRIARDAPDGKARTRALANLATLQYELGRRAELAATLQPWRTGKFPEGFAPDPDADIQARFVLGRVFADSCLALPVAHPIKPALDKKLAALGPALENLKAAARTVDSPYWGESGYFAGRLLDDLGARLAVLPPPTVMSGADSAGYRAAIHAQAASFFARAEDLWIATLEGLPPPAAGDSLAREKRPTDGWRGRIWEGLEPRLSAHYPWRFAITDFAGDSAAGESLGLVASSTPTAVVPARPDSTAVLDAGAREDLRNRLQWIAQYVTDGQIEDASAAADAALKLYPSRAEIWNDLGAIRQRQGRWGDASRSWDRALLLDPRCPAALYNRAVFERFYRLDRAAARRAFERFLTLGVPFDETLADRMAEEKQP